MQRGGGMEGAFGCVVVAVSSPGGPRVRGYGGMRAGVGGMWYCKLREGGCAFCGGSRGGRWVGGFFWGSGLKGERGEGGE